MSGYANFDPYDPEAVRFVKWLIEVASPVVTEFDATIERQIEDISSWDSPWVNQVPVGPNEVTVHLTLRGQIPIGAEYVYDNPAPTVQELPPGVKALP